jgi:hypothetical protein
VFSSEAREQLHWRAGREPHEQRASAAQTQLAERPLQQETIVDNK